MKNFLRPFSYLFHPLFMPLLGAALYWRFAAATHANHLLLPIVSCTVIVPLLIFAVLKKTGRIQSAITVSIRERIIPLFAQTVLFFVLIKMGDFKGSFPLYNFFIASMVSTLFASILLLAKVKSSLHIMGMMGVTTFLFLLGFYLTLNVITPLLLLILLTGLVGSSRLAMNAHTPKELIWGAALGALPQLLMASAWV